MRERGIFLSARLRMLAGMVTPGNRIVDVGCDHGYLSIYLVQTGICPGAVGMDLREGPLSAARAHVEEYGLGDYIDLRLSDGLAEYVPGEAQTMICAGMGGRLMEKILTQGMEKAGEMKELILQPQSELSGFRSFLRSSGFDIVREEALREDGKFYFAMKVVPGGKRPENAADAAGDACPEKGKAAGISSGSGGKRGGSPGRARESEENRELYDLYGELLLKARHPVLEEYLRRQEKALKSLAVSLGAAAGKSLSEKAFFRHQEVLKELEQNQKALAFYT